MLALQLAIAAAAAAAANSRRVCCKDGGAGDTSASVRGWALSRTAIIMSAVRAAVGSREGLWRTRSRKIIACPRLHKQTTGDRSDEPPD